LTDRVIQESDYTIRIPRLMPFATIEQSENSSNDHTPSRPMQEKILEEVPSGMNNPSSESRVAPESLVVADGVDLADGEETDSPADTKVVRWRG
jgi:hypothetical protein